MGIEQQVVGHNSIHKSARELSLVDKKTGLERFPENTEQRLEFLLTSFKTSPKSVVLMLIHRASGYISTKDLCDEFRSVYSGTEFEDVEYRTPLGYCDDLVSKGIVRRLFISDKTEPSKAVGFSLTEEGTKYAVPTASLALHFEFHHKLSLSHIFGTTNKSSVAKHGAPYNRAVALKFLVQAQQPVREVEFVHLLETSDSVACRTLDALVRAGIVNKSVGKRVALFTVNKFGEIVYKELINLLIGLIEDNQLVQQEVMSTIVPEITSNLLGYAKGNLELYYAQSHSFKMKRSLQTKECALDMLSRYPQGLNARQLAGPVGLQVSSLQRNVLNPLIKQGEISARTQRGVIYYSSKRQ